MSESEYEIFFSDQTILEAGGDYREVKQIMSKEVANGFDWMLRSQVSLVSESGSCDFVLHFFNNGDVVINEYSPSMVDVLYNLDIRCLSNWCQQMGWHLPKVKNDLVKQDIVFWKFYWETLLVDSDYLTRRFGDRSVSYEAEEDQ